MPADLSMLMQMLGGQSTPPALGGPQPPAGMPYPFGALGGNDRLQAALQGIGAMKALEEIRKLSKTQSTVGMQLDKPTRVDPMGPGVGPADIQARAARMASQQAPGAMPPGGAVPPPGAGGGMPGGAVGPPGALPPGQLMAMLAARRMGAM